MNIRKIAVTALLGSSLLVSRVESQALHTVLVRETTLREVKRRIAAHDSALTPAYRALLAAADRALAIRPLSVMEKSMMPPSGDKHDYMSYAPYYWPDSTKAGGIPYVVRDGVMNPASRVDHDGLRIQATTDAVQALSLAYFFTGDAKYSKRAAKLLRVFFLDAATRMNPNLQYAQAIPGITPGRGIGLVDTRILPQLVDAVSLLSGAPGWTRDDERKFKRWCREFLTWMRTSKNGNDERNANNNHGTWYDAQVVALALFTGDTVLARSVLIDDTERRIGEHFQPDGSQPRELARTRPLHYTLFNLDPYTQLAEMAPRVGVDLWRYKSPAGGSIRKGLAWIAPYTDSAKKWSKPEVGPLTFDDFFTPLARGYERVPTYQLQHAIGNLPKAARDTSRTILLYPRAIVSDTDLSWPDEPGPVMPDFVPMRDKVLRAASRKLRIAATELDPANGYPRSTGPDGSWIQRPRNEWTSGFFGGALWYMYALDSSPEWKALAEKWTRGLEADKEMTTTHDLGFLIFNSFGHGYLLTGDPHYKSVVMDASANLAKRYNPRVGMIKSWDTERSGDARSSWKFPVIIDNMMNLEMLFWASENGGSPTWADIAHTHALNSARVLIRDDGSTAHVALFDPVTGKLIRTVTWQGYSDSSAWARGQAWAIYGFTEAYHRTGDPRLLDAARKAAEFFLAHIVPGKVPYWDLTAPATPGMLYDASAAAIAASGLFALARALPEDPRYVPAAVSLLYALATDYLAPDSSASILMHAVGNKPQNSEVDVGLVYADYYFIEALARERELFLPRK